MKNLHIWQKLVLLVLVLLFPLVIVTYRFIAAVNSLGIAFAQKEIAGTQYSYAVRVLLEHLQQHRAITIALVGGDQSFQEKFAAKQKELREDLQTLDQVDAQLAEVLRATEAWQQRQVQIQTLLEAAATLDAHHAYEQHTRVIASVLQFLVFIADTSNLILDPDLDSYYLMDVVVNQLPALAETLGQTKGIGITVTTQKTRSDAQQATLMKRTVLAENHSTAIRQALAKAIRYNPALQSHIEQAGQHTAEVTQQFLTTLDQQIITAPVITMPTTEYYDVATQAISATFAAYDHVMPVLTQLLQARIDRLSHELYKTLAWVAAGMSVVLLIGIFIIRDITHPLKTAMAVIDRIISGDVSTTVPLDGRRDEIGTLLASFDLMRKQLSAMAAVAEKIAARDLTIAVEPQSESDQLGRALADMVQNLLGVTSQLHEGTLVLTGSISQILTSMSQLSASSTETATAVSQTVTTVEEVKQTVHLTGQKVQEVSQQAQHTASIAEKGEHAVEEAIVDMRSIREQMESIAQGVAKLSEQSYTIATIMQTVDNLAEQSNLLALNAEIEAAKAGTHSQGFTVVAQEVRNLATQSKQATTKVRAILQEIGKASALAISVTQNGTASVEKGLQQSLAAGEAIHFLARNVADATHAFTLVSTSSEQQLMGMEQIAQAMQAIKQYSVHHQAGLRQIEGAVRELHSLGQELQGLMRQYKLASLDKH